MEISLKVRLAWTLKFLLPRGQGAENDASTGMKLPPAESFTRISAETSPVFGSLNTSLPSLQGRKNIRTHKNYRVRIKKIVETNELLNYTVDDSPYNNTGFWFALSRNSARFPMRVCYVKKRFYWVTSRYGVAGESLGNRNTCRYLSAEQSFVRVRLQRSFPVRSSAGTSCPGRPGWCSSKVASQASLKASLPVLRGPSSAI